jgi:hypothetical protein
MTPQETIETAVKAYPGTLEAVARESGISRTRLHAYVVARPGAAQYRAPREEDARAVVTAVRTLLVRALTALPPA